MPEGKSDAQLTTGSASFFLNKIKEIRFQFQNADQYIPEDNASVPKLHELGLLTEEEIEKEICSMNNKNCELDAVPTHLIKNILPVALKTITKIVNTLLTTSTFPLDWKTAIVRLLIKRARLERSKKNYRPVSNLCSLSKLVECCMLRQFLKHCNNNCLLPNYQSAYWANYRMDTSLVKMANNIM